LEWPLYSVFWSRRQRRAQIGLPSFPPKVTSLHFTALMPVWPTLETRTENADDGSIIGIGHLFRAEDTDYGLLCVAGYVDHVDPVEIEGEFFVKSQETWVKLAHATVTASRRTTFARSPTDLLPSIEFTAGSPDQVAERPAINVSH
jgi:hypothetical protein